MGRVQVVRVIARVGARAYVQVNDATPQWWLRKNIPWPAGDPRAARRCPRCNSDALVRPTRCAVECVPCGLRWERYA